MLAQIMTLWPKYSPNFLRTFSVKLFISFLYVPVALCLAPGLAFKSFLAYIYVKYIVSLVQSYAITHVSKWIDSIRAQKFLIQIWAISVCFIGIFRLAYINQLYPREKKNIS